MVIPTSSFLLGETTPSPPMSTLILLASRVASKYINWMALRRFFPVRNPLFHATTGPRAESILEEGIRSDTGLSISGINQSGISLARSLIPLMTGSFGNVILVLDGDIVRRSYKTVPFQHSGVGDEMEERVLTDYISPSLIKGVIYTREMSRVEMRYISGLAERWQGVTTVFRTKEGWVKLGSPPLRIP